MAKKEKDGSQQTPLEDESFLRKLVSEGRIPAFITAYHGRSISTIGLNGPVYEEGSRAGAVVFCVVPPEGIQPGDAFKDILGPTIGEVVSPEGVARGRCMTYSLTKGQAEEVRNKIIQIATSKE